MLFYLLIIKKYFICIPFGVILNLIINKLSYFTFTLTNFLNSLNPLRI